MITAQTLEFYKKKKKKKNMQVVWADSPQGLTKLSHYIITPCSAYYL